MTNKTIQKTSYGVSRTLDTIKVRICFSRKSYFGLCRNCVSCFAILIAIAVFTSCKESENRAKNMSGKDAVSCYKDFLEEIKGTETPLSEDLPFIMKKWRNICDSVQQCIKRDTVVLPHTNHQATFEIIHDSIKSEFYRLILSKERSYKDILLMKEAASSYSADSSILATAEAAKPFFSSLNHVPGHEISTKEILKSYRSFLERQLSEGIHSKEGLLEYIKEEDRHFRSFLSCLHELGNESITDITRNTEQCCMSVSRSVAQGKLDELDALVYITMRTNRRLIQNAQVCIDDIYSGRIKTQEQARAYIWMILQVYSSIDGFGLSLLSQSDKAALLKVAEENPTVIEKLNKELSLNNDGFADLPGLMMKILVATFQV